MEDLLKRLIEIEIANADRMDRIIGLLERDQAPFLEPDDACRVLGIKLTTSGRHRVRLKFFREHGFLTKFGSRNPFTYERNEVKDLASRIAQGKVQMPAV